MTAWLIIPLCGLVLGAGPDPATTKALKRHIKKSAYPELTDALYKANDYMPLFHERGTPTPRALAVVASVAVLDEQGVDRGIFKLGFAPDDARILTRGLAKRQQHAFKKRPAFSLTHDRSPGAVARMDFRLTEALIQYVLEFQYIRRAHPETYKKELERLLKKKHAAVLASVTDALGDPATRLKAMWPRSDRYHALMRGLARYRGLAADNAAPHFNPKHWHHVTKKPGSEGAIAALKALQSSLRHDGLFVGEPTGALDSATTAAIERFHSRYGLPPGGTVRKDTLKALAVPYSRRVAAIRTTLQRLRESKPERERIKTWVRVNIPAFQMTLFEDGKATRHHRVIVGSTKLDFDRTSWKQGYLNRTPLLETHLVEVVINPSWRPPPRILEEEFEGRENVVVPPGKRNPLGYAKFVLSRTNAVFMHDTNARKLFKKRRRAFSHGCVRVGEALDFAKHLLQRFADIDEATYQAQLDSGKEKAFKPTKELPVFVEYMTVEAGEDGDLIFHPDVYRFDKAYLSGRRPGHTARYGLSRLRPKSVPLVPQADYERLKADGANAPAKWPLALTP